MSVDIDTPHFRVFEIGCNIPEVVNFILVENVPKEQSEQYKKWTSDVFQRTHDAAMKILTDACAGLDVDDFSVNISINVRLKADTK